MKHIPAILLTLFVVAAGAYTISVYALWQAVFNTIVALVLGAFVLRAGAAWLHRQ